MVVAAALCADRAATAAPALRPQMGQLARVLASRLSVGLRQGVAVAAATKLRRQGLPAPAARPQILPDEALAGHHPAESVPFLFRLPPPVA